MEKEIRAQAVRALKERPQETMVLRIFDSDFQGTPQNHWGMDMEMPEWIERAHNTRSGRTFIMGTGPSLIAQQELIAKYFPQEEVCTVNRMKLWGELPFTPTHHFITEPGPVGDWGRIIFPQYDFPDALNRIVINWWPVTAPGWLWCPKAPDDIQVRWEGAFGMDDFLPPLPTAWASPLTATQFALWLGYTEIILLGVDTTQKGQAWDRERGRTQQPRNIRSIVECAERLSREVWRHGRKLYDATPGGRLNEEGATRYIDLEEFLSA
jgi:hypothetical protein